MTEWQAAAWAATKLIGNALWVVLRICFIIMTAVIIGGMRSLGRVVK